jgi:hypothetical protein
VGLCGSMSHCFGLGRDGGYGIKNNASKALQNCAYLIDIIILF